MVTFEDHKKFTPAPLPGFSLTGQVIEGEAQLLKGDHYFRVTQFRPCFQDEYRTKIRFLSHTFVCEGFKFMSESEM